MTASSVRDISHTLAIRHRGGVVLRFRLITTSHLTVHCLCCVSGHVLPKCHFSLIIFSPSSSLTFTDGTELPTEGYEREYKCAAWPGGSSKRRGTAVGRALEGGPTRLGLLSSLLQSLTSHSATGSYPGLVTTHQPPEQSRHHQMSANCKKVSTERR